MKVELTQPWTGFSGTCKTIDVVMYQAEGGVIARSKIRPTDRRSSDQLAVRDAMAVAGRHWQTLAPDVRERWQAHADKRLSKDRYGRPTRRPAYLAYVQANSVRLILGLPPTTEPPRDGFPMPLRAIEQVAGAPARAIGIRVRHGYLDRDGYAVIVRATPPLRNLHGTPPANAFRYVCGVGPQSAQPLSPDGGELTFANVKAPVAAGQHYAVEARIVRIEDGLLSPPVVANFIR